ncbi:hypothetical protein ACQP2F_14650 [Actinoplanes sp. CA-030573]|uniref:hypothetical protein n=1 Tax=Actinoplanes sp. CA-030573 TaxID=3239898 RepID=UPI003D94A6D5
MRQLNRWFSELLTALGVVGLLAVAPGVASAGPAVNGSFERVSAGRVECWAAAGAASTVSMVAGRVGGTAPQLRGAKANLAPVEWASIRDQSCAMPVLAGHAYTVGAWYQATSAVRASVWAYSSTSGWAKWFAAAPYSGSTPWARIDATTPAVPAGMTQLALSFAVDGSARLVLDDVSLDDATSLLDKPTARSAPFTATFGQAPMLVTNEYAQVNPTRTDAARSTVWQVTSGSLFAAAGNGDTGRVDAGRPNATSSNFTDSSVFRLNTVRSDFHNVSVSFNLAVQAMSSTSRTPAVSYDGVHIWLRHQSQYYLYSASVARRDGKVVLKKKCPGGPSNDGTYYTLGKETPADPVVLGQWMAVSASVQDNPSGSVTLILTVAGRPLVSAVDTGVGCAPITGSAPVGIRGDNARFLFNSFSVKTL